MQDLYIQMIDGKPYEHPITGDNLRQVFPGIDLENALPEGLAKFEKTPFPRIKPYEVPDGQEYELHSDGVVYELHKIREMTPEEKQTRINNLTKYHAQYGYQSWILNEELCSFVPPVPKPDDFELYLWDEPTISWKLVDPPEISESETDNT